MTRTVNTTKAYTCNLPSGKSIVVYFYEGDISQGIAFNGLLNDGKRFADRLLSVIDER
jgi:hypothetical protein